MPHKGLYYATGMHYAFEGWLHFLHKGCIIPFRAAFPPQDYISTGIYFIIWDLLFTYLYTHIHIYRERERERERESKTNIYIYI